MSVLPEPSGRVVVTGVGAVTPLGTGVDVFWPKVIAGESGIRRIQQMENLELYSCQIAGEVPDFEPTDWVDKKDARRMDPFCCMQSQPPRWRLRIAALS